MFQNKGLGFIKDNRIFRGVENNNLNISVNQKDILVIKEGDVIYSNGDASEAIFLLLEGEVKLKLGHKNVLRYQENDFFGEKEILENNPRNTSAIANTDCKLYPLRKLELLLNDVDILMNLNRKGIIERTSRDTEERKEFSFAEPEETVTEDLQKPVYEPEDSPPEVLTYENKLELDLEAIISEPKADEFAEDEFDYESFNKQLTEELEIKEKAAKMSNKNDDEGDEELPVDFWNLSEIEPEETLKEESPEIKDKDEDKAAIFESEEIEIPESEFSFKEINSEVNADSYADDEPDEKVEHISWDFTEPEAEIVEPEPIITESYVEEFKENEIDESDEVEAMEEKKETNSSTVTIDFNNFIMSVNNDITLQIKLIRKAAEKFKLSDYSSPHKFVDIINKETEVLEDYFKLMNEYFSDNISLNKNFFQTDVVLNEILTLNAEYTEEKKISLFKSFNTNSLLNVDMRKLYFAFYFILKYAAHLMKDGGDVEITAESQLEVSYIQLTFSGNFGISEDIFATDALKDDIINFTGLQIAKKIIEAHKGNISFISSGGNNIFTIELPYIKFNQD